MSREALQIVDGAAYRAWLIRTGKLTPGQPLPRPPPRPASRPYLPIEPRSN